MCPCETITARLKNWFNLLLNGVRDWARWPQAAGIFWGEELAGKLRYGAFSFVT